MVPLKEIALSVGPAMGLGIIHSLYSATQGLRLLAQDSANSTHRDIVGSR